MGCDSPACAPTERPATRVRVDTFRIDVTEVTQRAYAVCVEADECARPPRGFDPIARPHRPVVHVKWADAVAYCAFTHQRLPTEREWELAARGTDGRSYPWGDSKPDCQHAHTADCGEGPDDVGKRPLGASPYGVLDLAGNVDEWVADVYSTYGLAPVGPMQRVARGGAYDAWHVRSTARSALDPEFRDATLGFRCAGAR